MPGLIETGRTSDEAWVHIERETVETTPLGRLGMVAEGADACCFLVSGHALYVRGQVLYVNGGTYPTPNIISDQ